MTISEWISSLGDIPVTDLYIILIATLLTFALAPFVIALADAITNAIFSAVGNVFVKTWALIRQRFNRLG